MTRLTSTLDHHEPIHSYSERDVDHPSKRPKYESNSIPLSGETGNTLIVPSHPLGIRPLGNAYTARQNLKTNAGALAILPDESLLQILEFLDAPDLLRVGATCKALFAFSRAEELWKSLLIA